MSATEQIETIKEEMRLMAALLVRLQRRLKGLETEQERRKPERAEGSNVIRLVAAQ